MDNEKTSIYEKLMKFQQDVARLKKDKTNPHFKNSYVDINSVLDEVVPKISEAGILVLQPLEVIDSRNYLTTRLIDASSGEEIVSRIVLPDNLDAQKTGSALTYFRRYSLVSMLCLQAVDDDGKAGSSPVKEKAKPTEEMVLEMEALMKGDQGFKQQWLNYLNVDSFNKANLGQLEKAINQIRGK